MPILYQKEQHQAFELGCQSEETVVSGNATVICK
jgi:hypothetical protein